MLWIGIVLFVVVDAIVVYVVLKQAMAKRAGLPGQGLAGAGLADMARFAKTAAEETGNYMSANYGGDASTLPAVLQGLVERLAARAREEGMTFDREALKHVAATTVILRKAARAEDVNVAMKSVA